MRTSIRESAWFAFALLGVLGGFLYLTLPLNPVARMVPLAVAVPAILLVSLELLLELAPGLAKRYRFLEQKDVFGVEPLRESIAAVPNSELKAKRAGRELSVFAWVSSIPVLTYIFGFLIGVPLFLFLYLRWRSESSWRFSITSAGASIALLYFLFIELLRAPLYEGRLWIWLLR